MPIPEGRSLHCGRIIETLIQKNYPVQRLEMSKEDAIELFREKGEAFKVEIIHGRGQIEDEGQQISTSRAISSTCVGARTWAPPVK